ncbi:MAG: hypothetical protein MUE96_07810 [Bacteroidia bacterium]|nr:hypothetical protein [Bacteroidia bacterium]
MKYTLRVKICIVLLLVSIGLQATPTDSTSRSLSVMPGILLQPFLVGEGFGSAITYKMQFGINNSLFWPDIRFGVTSQQLELNTPHQYSYEFNGMYVQPGMVYYFKNPKKEKHAPYFGIYGHFGTYKHELVLDIIDQNWGTSKQYQETRDATFAGIVLEIGKLFTVVNNLKVSCGINAAVILQEPRTQTKTPWLLPGIGLYSPSGLGIGASLGVHYHLH